MGNLMYLSSEEWNLRTERLPDLQKTEIYFLTN